MIRRTINHRPIHASTYLYRARQKLVCNWSFNAIKNSSFFYYDKSLCDHPISVCLVIDLISISVLNVKSNSTHISLSSELLFPIVMAFRYQNTYVAHISTSLETFINSDISNKFEINIFKWWAPKAKSTFAKLCKHPAIQHPCLYIFVYGLLFESIREVTAVKLLIMFCFTLSNFVYKDLLWAFQVD